PGWSGSGSPRRGSGEPFFPLGSCAPAAAGSAPLKRRSAKSRPLRFCKPGLSWHCGGAAAPPPSRQARAACDQDQHLRDLIEVGISSRQVTKGEHFGCSNVDVRDHLEPSPFLRPVVRIAAGNELLDNVDPSVA